MSKTQPTESLNANEIRGPVAAFSLFDIEAASTAIRLRTEADAALSKCRWNMKLGGEHGHDSFTAVCVAFAKATAFK